MTEKTKGMEEGLRLNHVAVKERLKELAEELGGKLIAHKLYSDHPEDSYLYVVLVDILSVPHAKCVTWLANLDNGTRGSFNEGHYFEDFYDISDEAIKAVQKQAFKDFQRRSRRCYEAVPPPLY